MTMLANQDYPQEFAIVGVIDEQNPESMAWYFLKTFDGQGYNYNQQQVVMHGLPAIGANQYEGVAHIAELVEDCIAFFGPDAVAVNAPPQEPDFFANFGAPAANNVGAGNAAPGANQAAAPMNMNNNMFIEGWGGMGAHPQAGGRRRRATRRKVTRRKVTRRRATRRRSTRRRASVRRHRRF